MAHQMKIATCSYCGSRQTLRLSARDGHELACGSCGAPLHEMKWLKTGAGDGTIKRSPRTQAPHGLRDEQSERGFKPDPRAVRRPKRKKKRKGLLREAFEEVFDVFDDIFD